MAWFLLAKIDKIDLIDCLFILFIVLFGYASVASLWRHVAAISWNLIVVERLSLGHFIHFRGHPENSKKATREQQSVHEIIIINLLLILSAL